MRTPAWLLVLAALLGLATTALVTVAAGVDPFDGTRDQLRGPASAGVIVSALVLLWGALRA